MISKEQFIEIINWHTVQNAETDKLCEIFPNTYSAPILDNPFKLFDLMLKICFDEEGRDWISWWLYECKSYTDGTYDRTYKEADGTIVNVETVNDLWKIVKGCRQ